MMISEFNTPTGTTSEIDGVNAVCIYEHPGKLCQQKARELAEKLERFYFSAPPVLRAEINRRAEENRRRSGGTP